MKDLKYHKRALELIGQQAVFSGMKYPGLPASVAEWYSLTNAVELLQRFSNQDAPLHPSEFHISRHGDKELIVFMHENQGVLWWAFEKSDVGDPQIYINLDPPPDNWVRDTETFSTFVYTWLFDHFHWYEKGLFLIKGSKAPINNTTLELLNKEFIKEPFTLGQSREIIVYRFSSNDQKIMIANEKDKSTWQFSADTKESFEKLYEKFKHLFQ